MIFLSSVSLSAIALLYNENSSAFFSSSALSYDGSISIFEERLFSAST
jgi:hypothetical protein